MRHYQCKCPACSETIDGEKFRYLPSQLDSQWYQFQTYRMACPYCGVKLAYDRQTKRLMIVLGVIMIASIGLVFISFQWGMLFPIIMIVSARLFWKKRRLIVDDSPN